MRFHSHEGWLLEHAQKVTTRQYGSPEVLSGQPRSLGTDKQPRLKQKVYVSVSGLGAGKLLLSSLGGRQTCSL